MGRSRKESSHTEFVGVRFSIPELEEITEALDGASYSEFIREAALCRARGAGLKLPKGLPAGTRNEATKVGEWSALAKVAK